MLTSTHTGIRCIRVRTVLQPRTTHNSQRKGDILANASTRTFLDDKESFEAIVDTLEPTLLAEYRSYAALSLEAVFPNRVMVMYKLVSGAPADINVLTFGDISVTRHMGPVFSLSDGTNDFEVGLKPVKWKDLDVFLHVPQNFIFKWKGKRAARGDVQFMPHYAILIKTRSKEHVQIENHAYCVTLNNFKERFPNVDVRYPSKSR